MQTAWPRALAFSFVILRATHASGACWFGRSQHDVLLDALLRRIHIAVAQHMEGRKQFTWICRRTRSRRSRFAEVRATERSQAQVTQLMHGQRA